MAASVRADLYSIVLAGMGAVGGSLHGGASAGVHDLLTSAYETGDLARAIGRLVGGGGALAGFGHSVYRAGDPRHEALMSLIEAAWPGDGRMGVALEILELVEGRTGAKANVDFALGLLSWMSGMERGAGEAAFAVARTAGWIAHGLEEWSEEPLRFRPRARYVGPLDARGRT